MENKTFITADAERNIPVTEPERQYYFIEKAKEKLTKLKEEEKREFTFCVTTFGCQMNARDSEKLVGILEQIGYVEEPDEEKQILLFIIRVLFGKMQINVCTVV